MPCSGYRYYLVGDVKHQMHVGMGWCHDCEALVPMEKRPDADTQARLVQEETRLTQALDAQRREDQLARRWWQLIRHDSPQASRLKFELADLKTELEKVRTLRALLQHRISGNRCLR